MTANRSVVPYLLIAPAVLFLALLFIVPLVQTIWLAVSQDGSFSVVNFQTLTGDLNFASAIRNTFLLTIVVVPIQVAMALVMGSMVAKVGGGRETILWIWTIPLGISDLAAGLVTALDPAEQRLSQ